MTRIRRGGYVFVTWVGDHSPRHVHVYKDQVLVTKWNLEAWISMEGEPNRQVRAILKMLVREGCL